jgi:adenylate kinase family enzyme
MTRIAIVGISGSGKSTLARKIGEKLTVPVIHLDKIFWDVGWKERYSTREEFNAAVNKIAEEKDWIIDGNYRASLDNRLEKADAIVFLDFPKWLGLWRSFKRVFNRKQPFDKAEGVKERIDFAHVRFVLSYSNHEMYARVEKYKDTKKVYIVRNDREKQALLANIEAQSPAL